MRARRLVAVALTLLGTLGVQAVRAQKEPAGADRRPLDPDVISVRLLLGVDDRRLQSWDGKVRLDRGEVVALEGYRFRDGDQIEGRGGWKATSHLIRRGALAKATRKGRVPNLLTKGTPTFGPQVAPNGVVLDLKAPADATLTVETQQGHLQIPLDGLADGASHSYLNGRVEARRVPPGRPLVDGPDAEDFPAAAADPNGGAWVAYVVHKPVGPEVLESFTERPKSFADFDPRGGGDQIRLLRFADGKPGPPIDVTGPGLDVWRPSVAVDGDGKVIVAWSEGIEGNWDIYARRYDPGTKTWSEVERLTTGPGTDTDVVLGKHPAHGVIMAWQAWKGGQADIMQFGLRGVFDPVEPPNNGRNNVSDVGAVKINPKDKPDRVSRSPSNEWAPAQAFDKDGNYYIACDTYRNGNYDVIVRILPPKSEGGDMGRELNIARSPKYEARPSLATDPSGRVWVAYEERDENWGKDAENLIDGKGASLYRDAAVRVRCLDGDRVVEVPDPLENAPEELRKFNSFPRLIADRDGRIWLLFRHREEAIWGSNAVMVVGAVWVEYATVRAGKSWSPPMPISRSDGLLDNRPALVTPSDGPVLAFYSTDGRLRREIEFKPELRRRFWPHSGTPGDLNGSANWDIQVAALTPPAAARVAAEPGGTAVVERNAEVARPVHPNEAEDIQRMRAYRIKAGGETYQLLRGDFHRHTELSMDGGSDGALEDMWRYAIDAAGLDWAGNNDHDNGGGKEYTWWLVQKTTDLYQDSPRLTTMFTYERSNPYPHGHRNIMFARRGIRTLPRLLGPAGRVVDADTLMLYDYLRELGGLCASHTSATGMGTDWRDVNPQYEPFVEIFQGHRNSYEHLGAPRVARRPVEAKGGWRPLGMVWNALALQYRFGFGASSDHISTHISYAVAIAEKPDRAAILDAFRRRHCYAATDNIILDVRSGEHLMGDEFQADGPVRIEVKAVGTGPISRVDIIKDFKYVYSTEPARVAVEFEWTDEENRTPGLSWYYVRVQQADGQLAWGSPIWVHFGGAGK